MNVVQNWRSRARNLRGEYLRCDECGAFAAARRLNCTHCGARMSNASRLPLPRRLPAVAFSHAHLVVETLDQVAVRKPVALLRINDRQFFAVPLADADAAHASQLVGETLELVLRRAGTEGPTDALTYVRKAAASAATRAKLKTVEVTKVNGRGVK